MTLFAGAFSMSPERDIPVTLKAALSASLCRADLQSGTRQTHDTQRLYLTKWDSGAFSDPAWRAKSGGSVCTLAGDPLLTRDGERISRLSQLELLSPPDGASSNSVFRKCRGSFAFIDYDATDKTLRLATDAVGLRSIYYTVQNGLLIFATALRILEAIPAVTKTLSVAGMAELSAFSFPLAERTPYQNLYLLRESQILAASGARIELHDYRNWFELGASPATVQEAATRLHGVFHEAIRLRAGTDKRVYSFLSGGMDSRAIATTLIDLGCHVEALNFSADGSQDQRYAQSLAQAIGDTCRLHCLKGGVFPNFSLLALAAKTELEQQQATHVDRSQLIWSGDGGSVGLGHVYMDERMLDLGESGDTDAAIRYFLDWNRIGLPQGILSAKARQELPSLLQKNVRDEFDRYPVPDFGRRIYLFLLFNDQRRHLFKHFESIDQHGLELLTPFYDSEVLELVAATPSRWGILHRLYAQFFEHLPSFARQTPWQTYPGHVPCPLPHDEQASYQWAPRPTSNNGGLRTRAQCSKSMLLSLEDDTHPRTFSRHRVSIAALLHMAGVRDYEHLAPVLQTYRRHQAICRLRNAST